MIVCLRTVRVPADQRPSFLAWIVENGPLRRRHGILAEVVLERAEHQNPAKTLQPQSSDHDADDLVVMTVWPDHDTFDAWIDTPDRDRLTASPVHDAVEYRPLTRYDVVVGYLAETFPTGGQP